MNGVSRYIEVLKYLKEFTSTKNRMPSAKEAMHDIKIGKTVLYRILDRLTELGYMKRIPASIIPYRFTANKISNGHDTSEIRTE